MTVENPREKILEGPVRREKQLKQESMLEEMHAKALSGESFEDAAGALSGVEALRNFREKLRNIPFSSFHEVIEQMTNINMARFPEEEKKKRLGHLTSAMEERANRFSPRVADLYTAISSKIKGEQCEPKYDITAKKIAELEQSGDLDVLFSPDIPWDMKLNRIETRLTDFLLGAKALDKREGGEMDDDMRKWRQEQLKKAPVRPPEKRNESKPGVDPMERLKEGERAPAIWSINPAYGGYYKEQSFSEWDSRRNVWTEGEYIYSEAVIIPLCEKENPRNGWMNLTMKAHVSIGKWVALPVPYTHGLHRIEAGGRKYSAQKDQNGDLVIFIEGDGGDAEISVILAPNPDKKFTSKSESVRAPDMPSEFSEETNKRLKEVKNKERGNIARAHALASYVLRRVKYLAPKDYAESSRYNNLYNTHPNGFAGAVDEIKEADCDVANTYFAALCAKLNIPVRHCAGHSLRGRDEMGASNINSGTGHGWSEVWDEVKKEWIRMDATPPGDRQMEDQEKQESGESVPGDYGGQEAIAPTDEELEELRKKLAELKEKLSYTKEERQLAEQAGVELREARQIVKEISEAERTRLPNGELVMDALSRLFNAIIEVRKTTAPIYEGPVRKREGGESIEDIVRHKIGVSAGDIDPASREKPAEEIKEEKILGGFDLYAIGDKSGSMGNVGVKGEILWKMQRRAEYLIFSSLHRFESNLGRAGLQKENALSVRTQGTSFRGDGSEDIDLDKPLSPNLSAKDKVNLWHSLTEQGSGNGDPEALGYVYGQIKGELEEIKKRGVKDNRLRLVIACSDGGYVGDDAKKMQSLAEDFYKLDANVILVGIGLTETAKNVKVVMDRPPHSRGDIAIDINDLPAIVAKHLVLEAIKLFPDKTRESAKQIIESSLAKFKNI